MKKTIAWILIIIGIMGIAFLAYELLFILDYNFENSFLYNFLTRPALVFGLIITFFLNLIFFGWFNSDTVVFIIGSLYYLPLISLGVMGLKSQDSIIRRRPMLWKVIVGLYLILNSFILLIFYSM